MENLEALTDSGIDRMVADIDTTIGRANIYEAIAVGEHGKPLVMELHRRLDHIRDMYVAVDATSDSANVMLATLQATERELKEWLDRLEGSVTLIESLAGERSRLLEIAQTRKAYESNRVSQFLPGGYKKESSNG